MKRSALNEQGVTHLLIPIVVGLLVVSGLTFALVLRSDNGSKKTNQVSNKSATSSSQTEQTDAQSASTVSPESTGSQSSAPAPAPGPAKSPTKSTTTKTPSGSSTTPKNTSPSPTPAPAVTPLSTLTDIISKLQNGINAKVTSAAVNVPGPIGTATARPIVFTVSGQTYFAYTQGSKPNFNLSPAQTADTMAIVKATSSPALEDAHLDKSANLIDIDFNLVGYSTGGN